MIKKRKTKYEYTEAQLECLVKVGNRWTKHDKDRIYFNTEDILHWLGYDWSYYNTGNVSYASLDGEKISNYSFNKTCASFDKLWYDIREKAYLFVCDVASSYTPNIEDIIGVIEETAGLEE